MNPPPSSSSLRRVPSRNQSPFTPMPSLVPRRLPSMDQQPSSSSAMSPVLPSFRQLSLSSSPLSTMNQLPSTSSLSSSRLPSFRDMSGIQQALFNRAKMMNKKTYVPHLDCSRNVQPKLNTEENAAPTIVPKGEPRSKENCKGRRERKLLEAVETLAPETKPQRDGINLGIKNERIDRSVLKKVFSEELPTKFEGISSSSPQDLPVPIPESRYIPAITNVKKLDPLLTDVVKFDKSESPFYLLKVPRYLPAILDDLKSQSTSGAKEMKKGCSIQDLLEGHIGKLQILKSGRLRLVLGDCKFWLQKGVDVNLREELAIVKIDPESKTGDIVSLGEIKERIMVVPDVITKLNIKNS